MVKTFNEVYETLPARGWLTENEARFLWQWTRFGSGPILEVGSYCGRSTVLLAATGREIHAVDPFSGFLEEDASGDSVYDTLMRNLAEREIGNVTVHRVKVEDFPGDRVIPRWFTAAYLDGDHTYRGTLAQIEKAKSLGAKVFILHDVNDSGDGKEVKRAAVEALGDWDARVERMAVWLR